jgi:hypothetical protein
MLVLLVACSRPSPSVESSREATVPSSTPSGVTETAPASSLSASASTLPATSAASSGSAKPSEPAPAASAAAPASAVDLPALKDASGQVLAQTEDKPRTDSRFFQEQARKLFDAIVADDPGLARSFFFPVVAYEQVKDVKNPARDWQHRLIAAFERQVHEYHRLLGKRRAEARFLRLEVPEERAEWMKPGREGNRVGYFRVLRSRLFYADADGKERSLEVTSLISWRGEWYLVHLHGFE